MKVFLVDDHDLFRSGLKLLLSNLQKDIQFEEASNCEDVISFANKESINLILLDLYLPGIKDFDALTRIKQHYKCKIIVLTSEDNPQVIRNAIISHGASGFIPKSSSPEVLVAALQVVIADGTYVPPHILSDDVNGSLDANTSDQHYDEMFSQLSKKQRDVLTKAAQGKSNKIIARELHIAEGTVKAHLSACYHILGVNNRTEAVYAIASILLPEH